MKVILLLLALAFSCAIAQTSDNVVNPSTYAVKEWTGTTQLSPLWYPPTFNQPCTTSTGAQNYAVMNVTFAAAGTRIVGVVAERGFSPYVQVLLYKDAFTPSATAGQSGSCNNLVRKLQVKETGDLGFMIVNDPTYFEAGTTYFFVVTGSATGAAGRFALTIYASNYMGDTTNGPIWIPSTTGNGPCANDTTAPPSNVAVFNYQSTIAGYADFQIFFASTSTLDYDKYKVYVTLTTGSFTAAQMATNSCSVTPNKQLITAYNGDQIAPIYKFELQVDVVYTIAVSNAAQAGAFGIQVLPSRAKSAAGGFAQPQRTLPCAANTTATSAGYVVYPIPANNHGQQVFIETYPYPNWVGNSVYFVNWAFVYSGANSLTTCPTAAPLIAVNQTNVASNGVSTGSIVFSTTPGKEYSVIFSTSDGQGVPTGSQLPIFMFTGEWVGNPAAYVPDNGGVVPTTTGATATTGTPTNSSSITTTTSGSTATITTTTSGATNGGATSGGATNGGTPSPTTTETSSASAIAVSALVLVAVAALL